MISLFRTEQVFQDLIRNLPHYLHDAIIQIDDYQLRILGLCDKQLNQPPDQDHSFCRFCVAESGEKLTLINESFISWIVPKWNQLTGETLILVATYQGCDIQLISALVLGGERNSPNAVLKVLERVLIDVWENNLLCTLLGKSSV